MDSKYFDLDRVREAVAAGRQRELVGGAWDEIGELQFEFLKGEGLRPSHNLLDIGCGSLRGGTHFVRYLDPGKYFGVDINESLLAAGYEIELRQAGLQDRLPRQNLRCTGDFDLGVFDVRFDFALAQSLFTHLTFNRIRQCLERLADHMKPGGTFFATFFELPEGAPACLPALHSPGGVTTHDVDDPYHYRFEDLKYAAAGLPWAVRHIGDWRHPRDQRMAAFVRLSSRMERAGVLGHAAQPASSDAQPGNPPANRTREEGEQPKVARACQPGIIVLSMHRSGTSLVAELVQRWGAYGKEEALMQEDAWNERGYWEYGPLVDFNEALLRAVDSSWHVPPADSDRPRLAALAQDASYRDRALRLLEDMQAGGRPWFWKDPRLPVLLPFWKQVWGDVVYVVPVRDPVDIALSLQRRAPFSMSRSLLVWQRYMSEILLDQDVSGAALFLSYEKLLADEIGECSRLCRFLDERLATPSEDTAHRSEFMAGAIVPELRKNRNAIGFAQSPIATPAQKALYGMLEGLAGGTPQELAPTGPEPHWREHLIAESAVQAKPEPKDRCEVFWRTASSDYLFRHRRSAPVKEERGPQSLRIALPPGQHDPVTALRIELSQRAGFAKVDELTVQDTRGNVVWAWDGRPASIQNLSLRQIRFCERQPTDRGCMLQLEGNGAWLEVVLDASQSAALVKGAAVVVQCEYIPSSEYLLQESVRMAAELRESSARLEKRIANLAVGMAGIEERVTKAEETEQAILQSRIWRLLTAGGGLLLRATGKFPRNDNSH